MRQVHPETSGGSGGGGGDGDSVASASAASLLPTLLVPSDPEHGTIERPRTPPRVPTPREPTPRAPKSSIRSAREGKVPSLELGLTPSPEPQDGPKPSSTPSPSPIPSRSPDAVPIVTTREPPAPPIHSKDYVGMAKRARALARMDRLAGGAKSLLDVDMSDIGALGIGLQLYFMLTKYLSITFLVMGMLALPAITAHAFGNGVTEAMVDPLKLAYASLGNEGVHPDIATDASQCLPRGDIDCTWTTVQTPFTSDPVTVSWIVTISDVVHSLAFLLFLVLYRRHAQHAIAVHLHEHLTPAKYTVFVRGLPRDAHKREILAHFHSLFDPTVDDEYAPLWFGCCWGRRRKVLAAARNREPPTVVQNVDHLTSSHSTRARGVDAVEAGVAGGAGVAGVDAGPTSAHPDEEDSVAMYLGTWVAEVSVAHPTGGLLQTFLSMEALTRNISDTNELIHILQDEKAAALAADAAEAARGVATNDKGQRKKNKNKDKNRPTFKLADEKLLQYSLAKLARLEARMERKRSRLKMLKKAATAAATLAATASSTLSPPEGNAKDKAKDTAKDRAQVTASAFDWDACQCAFVVFNCLESRRRCLRDYRRSSSWLARHWQPRKLRFRNGQHRLIVTAAPEPSNILWENLEISDRGRLWRRSLTNFITFLLLLLSGGIISGAQSAQTALKNKMVNPTLCEAALPQVFYGNASYLQERWVLAWDAERDAHCAPAEDGTARFHIAYTNGIVADLVESVNGSQLAPPSESRVRCVEPCISETSSRTCSTLPCFLLDASASANATTTTTMMTTECETYPEATILYCFCKSALQDAITAQGLLSGPQQLWRENVPCRSFITDYLTRNALLVVAAGIVVVVNLLLKSILRAFAKFEAHASESARARAVVVKMLGAQVLNTCVIVLVVNASMGRLSDIPLLGELLQGKFVDFERDWYPTVGMGITMTMLINAAVPQLVLLAQIGVLAPIRRWLTRRSIRSQDKMNALYAGPPFDIAVKYPMVLNSVIVTMAFSGGSPVLLFIAALTATATYWVDKLSLLHLYSVKTAYDEALGEFALLLLPWTLVVHLAFATWMFGNTALMKATTVPLSLLARLLGLATVDAQGQPLSDAALYELLLARAGAIDVLGQHGLVVKVVRANVMVVFLFLVAIVAALLLSTVASRLLVPVLRRTLGIVLAALWKRLTLRQCVKNWWARRRQRRQQQAGTPAGAKKTATVHVGDTLIPGSVPATPGEPATAGIPPTAAMAMEKKELDPVPAVATMADEAALDPLAVGAGETTPVAVVAVPSPAPASAPAPVPDTAPSPAPAPVPDLGPTPEPAAAEHTMVEPEYTALFRRTVAQSFRPDARLGFERTAGGELIRVWPQDTVTARGVAKARGERMRTWEAMQAPLTSYAIEANARYRLAVGELEAAAQRMRLAAVTATATATVEPVEVAMGVGVGVDTALEATEPINRSQSLRLDAEKETLPNAVPSGDAEGSGSGSGSGSASASGNDAGDAQVTIEVG